MPIVSSPSSAAKYNPLLDNAIMHAGNDNEQRKLRQQSKSY